MKLITRKTDYAIRALCYIAKQDEKVNVFELAEKLKIPQPFLRGIMQILNNKGLLKSFKGSEGGFILARPPKKIFLTNVLKIFQGPIKLNECIAKKKICPDIENCSLKKEIEKIKKYIESKLNSITIDSLILREE